ncbi:MAG: hypothetical protein K9J37_10985 [Saprospiraceae bacterium]|nr:hypothetical protein [Saprospiraceae bacterium]MCF8250430.1 hypothetical protein [Saprospiraceae bacterium]MCF8280650.1 hypothetical protein [Bacteroidales bacterium]MCF8312195.1 hypothetical protein [Saprospiraceae bacterium]MCF8440536.1 hypothetical protein [Saprospiraceae bacterium]
MAHYNFNKDLLDGQAAEQEVAIRLTARLNLAEGDIEHSSSKGYDLKIISKGWTFEVKNDLMAHQTGNVAVEYESRGKKTALAVTTAEFWVYKFAGSFYAFKTETLRRKLFEEKLFFREVVGGDPGSNTKMYLVKVEAFKSWGKEI